MVQGMLRVDADGVPCLVQDVRDTGVLAYWVRLFDGRDIWVEECDLPPIHHNQLTVLYPLIEALIRDRRELYFA